MPCWPPPRAQADASSVWATSWATAPTPGLHRSDRGAGDGGGRWQSRARRRRAPGPGVVQSVRPGCGRVDARAARRRPPGLADALPLVREVEDATLVHASPAHPEEWDYLVSADDGCATFRGLRHPPLLRRTLPRARDVVAGLLGAGLHDRGAVESRRSSRAAATSSMWAASASLAITIRARRRPCGTSTRRAVTLRRVAYDIGAAQAKIQAAGLPRFLADRLAEGR